MAARSRRYSVSPRTQRALPLGANRCRMLQGLNDKLRYTPGIQRLTRRYRNSTAYLGGSDSARQFRGRASQILKVLSWLELAIRSPSGENATLSTAFV